MSYVSSQDVAQLGLIFFSSSLLSSSINHTVVTTSQNNVIGVKVDSSCKRCGKSRVHNSQMPDHPGEGILYGGT
jgi:hypothetical protein